MKNLKYIYALSSLFVSFFAFDYATNFNDATSSTTNDESEEKTTQDTSNENAQIIDDVIKYNIINSYNSALSSSHTLKLNKGNLVYKNNNKPVTLDFDGTFSISNNSLNSYVIDASYTYDSSKETFKVNSGSISSSTIIYNNNVYTFSSSNELSGILSFPSTKDSKYPIINLDFSFSTIFSTFLKINYENYKVYSSSTGYTFISDNTSIKVDDNYNLLEVNSNYSDEFTFYLNFKELDSESTSAKAIEDSTDFVTTLKGLFNDSNFDVTYNASIKSTTSNNLKYNGFVTYNGTSLSLNVNEFINNNLQNEITSTFRDDSIYFNISNGLEKGNLIDSEETDLVSATSGLMSNDTEFDYSFNAPLNALINTSMFQDILDLNLSSSYIKNLNEEGNIKRFKVDSSAFGLTSNSDIRFELELVNDSLKSISIKDFKTTTSNTMDIKFNFNETKSNTVKINSEAYPIYNSMLPYYKKITFIVNEIKVGGEFNTSIINNNDETVLGLSIDHYDFNLGKSINNISLKDLNASLKGVSINFNDYKDSNKTLTTATALFLEDTTSTAQNSFNLEIESLNYKAGKFYIVLNENGSSNKYTLENDSMKGLIESIKTLTANNSSKSNSTSSGFDAIKKEYTRISNLVKQINTNYIISELKYDIEHNKSFRKLTQYMTITPKTDSISVKFNLGKVFETSYFKVGEGYGDNATVGLTLSKKGEIVSLDVDDVSLTDTKNTVTSTSLGLNDFNNSNILDDTTIKEEWDNTEDKVNSKDLNEVISKIDDTVQIFNSMIKSNSVLQNLISIDFAYKNKKLSGSLSTKFHFDENSNIDDKYIEGSIPLSIKGKSETNDLSGLNLQFIYSDSDNYDTLNEEGKITKNKSKFIGIVGNDNKLTAGTQIGLSLNYAKDDNGRSASKLYAYSDHDTVNSMLVSLSGLNENNTLWPYEIIRTVQKYALNVKNVLNPDSVNTIELLKNLGITDSASIMKLLNSLDTSDNKLSVQINLGALSGEEAFNEFNVNITLNFNKDDTGKVTSLSSINLVGVEDPSLKVDITLKSTSLQGDNSETLTRLETSETEVLSGNSFTPYQESTNYEYKNSTVNYIDASNVYNLLQLGIYTTDRKYYNIKGTLNFGANASLFPGSRIETKMGSEVLNDLYFNIKLNLFKDPKPGNFGELSQKEQDTYTNKAYKIQGYLKVAISKSNDNTEDIYNDTFTEFFIEPGATADAKDGTVYIFKSNGNKGTQSYKSETLDTLPENYEYDSKMYSLVNTTKAIKQGYEEYSRSSGLIGTYNSKDDAINAIKSEVAKRSDSLKFIEGDPSNSDFTYYSKLVDDTSNPILKKSSDYSNGIIYHSSTRTSSEDRDNKYNEIINNLKSIGYSDEDAKKFIKKDSTPVLSYTSGQTIQDGFSSKGEYWPLTGIGWGAKGKKGELEKEYPELNGKLSIEEYKVKESVWDWYHYVDKYVTYYKVVANDSINISEYYIKVNQNLDSAIYAKKTEWCAEATHDIYIAPEYNYTYSLNYNYSYDVEMYKMSKEQFLGNMNITVSSKTSGTAPILLYYLLDYSEIISNNANVSGINIRNILLGSLYKSIDDSKDSEKPKINYLNGWNLTVNSKGEGDDYYVSDGDFYIYPVNLIGDIISGDNTVKFNTGLNLHFEKEISNSNFDQWNFTLQQTTYNDDTKLVSLKAGSIFSINISIDTSYFSFITSNNSEYISNQMLRYNSFISAFNSENESKSNGFGYTYPSSVPVKHNSLLNCYIYDDKTKIQFTNNGKFNGTLHDYRFFQGLN